MSGLSSNNPMAVLQREHNKPRIKPLLWQWSTERLFVLPLRQDVSGLQHIAHSPFCDSKRALYSCTDRLKNLLRFCFLSLSRCKAGFFCLDSFRNNLSRSLLIGSARSRFLLAFIHFLQVDWCFWIRFSRSLTERK